jgi:nickel transport protein
MKFIFLFLVSIICFLTADKVCAHGIHGRIGSGGLMIEAAYDGGEPLSYAKVTIAAPGATLPFQSGYTDRNGRFCFFPDADGQWNVVVNDEMGHRLEIKVPVNEKLALQPTQHPLTNEQGGLSRAEKALMGVCIIFGIGGLCFWWLGRNSQHSKS